MKKDYYLCKLIDTGNEGEIGAMIQGKFLTQNMIVLTQDEFTRGQKRAKKFQQGAKDIHRYFW